MSLFSRFCVEIISCDIEGKYQYIQVSIFHLALKIRTHHSHDTMYMFGLYQQTKIVDLYTNFK